MSISYLVYKVLIRPLSICDSSTSFNWRNDEEIWRYTGSKPNVKITEEIERNWLLEKLKESNSKRFAIEVNDVYVGNIQLTSINQTDAEFHIFIGDKSLWGKGISYSAIQQIIRYAESTIKLDKIYLKVNAENEKAIRLYKKCGFKEVDESIRMELKLNSINKPMVSILTMVYNHEPYLENCLKSILMQKCLFDYEIVIGEDFSTDNSRKILFDYQNKYPGKIKLLLQNKNIGAVRNQNQILKECKGKYIALCEGDDYWTDPYKLQKQVDLLEANEDKSLVCTQYAILNEKSTKTVPYEPIADWFNEYPNEPCILTKDNFLNPYFLKTCTVLFRRDVFLEHLHKISSFKYFSDVFLFSFCFLKGQGLLIKDCTAVYRVHDGGIWSLKSDLEKQRLNYFMFREMNNYYSGRFIAVNEAYLCALKNLYSAIKKDKNRWRNLKVVFDYWRNRSLMN